VDIIIQGLAMIACFGVDRQPIAIGCGLPRVPLFTLDQGKFNGKLIDFRLLVLRQWHYF
jgi:hypothetical protein